MNLTVLIVGCLLAGAVGAALGVLTSRPYPISPEVRQMAEDAAKEAVRKATIADKDTP